MTGKPIVAATDGSEDSLRAVEWAAGEALLHAVPLRIVSAVSLLPWMTGPQVPPDRDYVADLIRSERDRALGIAASRAAATAPGLVIVTDPLPGSPAQAVTESGSGALMLVVGSRGVGAFTAMMLGSVSRYVTAHATCPVVAVRDQPPATHGLIGIGVSDPDGCADSLAFAFEEARLRKASLTAIYAWPLPGRQAGQAEAARQLSGLLDHWQEEYPGVPVSQEVVPGHPGRALVGLSARADLTVMGRRAGHPRPQGPGTVRHAVLEHALGPVAIVPSGR
jgi:nucleotide-binding universal stress UspA family protein